MAYLGDKHYIHVQSDGAIEWVVTHNLDKIPAISIVNESGIEIFGQITHIDKMVSKIKFSEMMRGRAYCN